MLCYVWSVDGDCPGGITYLVNFLCSLLKLEKWRPQEYLTCPYDTIILIQQRVDCVSIFY